jgi:pilus assembly protein Flp/PilA
MLLRFLRDQRGATAIEYGLIALLISVATIGGITAVGESSTVTLETISDKFPGS